MRTIRAKLIFIMLLLSFAGSFFMIETQAQIQVGTVKGIVTDEKGGVLPGATVTLENAVSGFKRTSLTEADGSFIFNHVPFNPYKFRATFEGFQPVERDVHVRSNVPVVEDVHLKLAAVQETVTVKAETELVEHDSSTTHVDLDQSFIERVPGANPSRGIESILATTPGWVMNDAGRLHVRGTESQILYVIDGIPIIDRLDPTYASSIDTRALSSLEIITGNIPAEFGNKLGGVVNAKMKSGIDIPLSGGFTVAAGKFNAGEFSAQLGGRLTEKLGFFLTTSVSQSHRFLDPPDPRNFNNQGGTGKINLSTDWHPTSNDIIHFNFSTNGTKFHVPNRLAQEVAGQRQRQELKDNSQTVFWQHIWSPNTVTNFALYRRYYQSKLLCNNQCTPFFAEANRHHTNYGTIASLSTVQKGHNIKVGAEFFATPTREFFTFFITNPEQVDVTPAAAAFVAGNPFIFGRAQGGAKTGHEFSAYLQDSFSPFKNLTVSAGLRYDRYKFLLFSHQFSPRVGFVYYIPATRTAIRTSYNRFFIPPPVEYLLLAGSPVAASLSPFTQTRGGAADIQPDKQHVYEVGFSQDLFKVLKLDVAYYWKKIRNFSDRDQFLDTAIIFPISIARGDVQGLDVRVDLPERGGFSGYVSYSNSRAFGISPINGGLFLSRSSGEIQPGLKFPNDHDQRNTGTAGLTYQNAKPRPWWVNVTGRHESGVPFDFEPAELERLRRSPGGNLVNFDRGRVKPRSLLNFSVGMEVMKEERARVNLQFDVQNLTNRGFVYNFQSVFSGTHFGYPRLWSGRLSVSFN